MQQTFVIALRNITRNRRRTLLAASAVFLGVLALLMLRGLLNGVQAAQRTAMVDRHTGALQVHRAGYMKQVLGSPLSLAFPADEDMVRKLRAIPHVRGVSLRLQFGALLNANDNSLLAMVTAFDPAAEFAVCPLKREDIASGAPISSDAPSGVVPAGAMVRRLQWKPGQPAAVLATDRDGVFNGVEATLQGTAGLPNVPGVEARTMMMGLKQAQELLRLGTDVTEIAIAVDDMRALREVTARVAEVIGGDFEVTTWEELAPQLLQEERNQNLVFSVFVFIFILAALVGITNTMLVNMLERTREIGTMLALGARRRRIVTLFVTEGMVLGLVGCVAGTAVATTLIAWLNQVGIHLKFIGGGILHIYPYTDFRQAAGLALVCAFGAVLASLSPAYRAARMSPAQALTGSGS